MIDGLLSIRQGAAEKAVPLAAYLDAAAEERAHDQEYRWIKSLRQIHVGGTSFRDRFTVRGDSLWWFTELYLHKEQVILQIHRTLAALDALLSRESPGSVAVVEGSIVLRHLVPRVASSRGVGVHGSLAPPAFDTRLRALEWRARRLAWSAYAAPGRWRPRAPAVKRPQLAAFVHRAFWKGGGENGSAESYIGSVLHDLEARIGSDAVAYVGVGPVQNFRTGRAWRPARTSGRLIPVEALAPLTRLSASRHVWRDRKKNLAGILDSVPLREASVIGGVDCWPLVREAMTGVAWLQWPWSARAMDEAGAALDLLTPSVALTYAEAGGWGRALVLEARRRGMPTVGLQHGFIYRHWLNYRHEPDEMTPTATAPFPAPTRTLLFDEHAAVHLRTHGRFDEASLAVTGSPRLDALAAAIAALPSSAIEDVRRGAGLDPSDVLVLVATKEREARAVLPELLRAAAGLPHVVLVVKPHPAETAEVYAAHTAGYRNVRVLPPSAPLAPLLAAARAVVTVNSTVALDAAVLDVPALSLGLPNNLTPFVDAGAIAGCAHADSLPGILHRILYDDEFRQRLAERRRSTFGRTAVASDGRSAGRSALAVQSLIEERRLSKDSRCAY